MTKENNKHISQSYTLQFPNVTVTIQYDADMAPLSLSLEVTGSIITITARENPIILEEVYHNLVKCEIVTEN